jgi:hypothetical protein
MDRIKALYAIADLMEQHEHRTGCSVTESAGRAVAATVVIGPGFEDRFANLWETEGPAVANATAADNMRLLGDLIGLLYPGLVNPALTAAEVRATADRQGATL